MPVAWPLTWPGAGTLVGLAILSLSGCAASLPTIETQSLQNEPVDSSAADTTTFAGKPAVVYTRIARKIRSCWLAPGRPLNATHQFHAQVEPERKGGNATIVIYQNGPKAKPRQRLAAMRVTITRPSPARSQVAIINRRFPATEAKLMITEILGWATGNGDCRVSALPGPGLQAQGQPTR